MELFILIISVPLFLIVVLLLSVFVLANYSSQGQEKGAPAEAEVRAGDAAASEGNVVA